MLFIGAWRGRCDVIAPSLIPSRPGDRVKTDRRDALTLAAALRAGQLTAVWTTHEAIRSLGRTAADDVRRAKQQIIGFCFVHERIYDGKSYWTRSHRRWLVEQTFEHEALAFVFSELLMRLEKAEGFRERVRAELAQTIQEWALYPVVEAIQALRGFGWENAAIVVAEIGDIRRFATAPQFMAYLGLTPSEASSGGPRRHHQSRQWPGPHGAGGGGLDLPFPCPSQSCHPPARRRLARAAARQGLGCTGEIVPAIARLCSSRHAQPQDRHRHRSRVGRLSLGHRPHGAAQYGIERKSAIRHPQGRLW
jgi:hypothetical protein